MALVTTDCHLASVSRLIADYTSRRHLPTRPRRRRDSKNRQTLLLVLPHALIRSDAPPVRSYQSYGLTGRQGTTTTNHHYEVTITLPQQAHSPVNHLCIGVLRDFMKDLRTSTRQA